jgi:hypothetical protein
MVVTPFSPLDRCLRTLRTLISAGDVGGIFLAERAADKYLASHAGPDLQAGALYMLEAELAKLEDQASPAGKELIELLSSHLETRLRKLLEMP